MYKIVFMGTPEFAVPTLDMLIKNKYEIAAVVTQPDKPKGRGKKMATPPVKEYALSLGIDVLQPSTVRNLDFATKLREISPDLLITVAYGKILPQDVLDIPKMGCINVHASLLPKYRGAAPINWAIINGEKESGITTMYTDIGMDTGDILLKDTVVIDENMTAGELHDKLSTLGASVLKKTLEELRENRLQKIPQQHDGATYAPMLSKEVGCIDWLKSAKEIHNLVRGTCPWPGAYTSFKGERMKVWKTEVLDGDSISNNKPGTIQKIDPKGIDVICGKSVLRVIDIQCENKKKMCVDAYLCGNTVSVGDLFG